MDDVGSASWVTGGALPASSRPRRMPLPLLFILRLDRLVMLKSKPHLTPEQRKLVDHALYSTYWDCIEAGLRTEARDILGMPPE